jgi:hypothetical protein
VNLFEKVDCNNTPEGPQIYHSNTLTTKLKFEYVIQAIKNEAFNYLQ